MRAEALLRRTILFGLGIFGLWYEITRVGDVRPVLILTDLILIGLVPAELAFERIMSSRGPKKNGDAD
jgi:hypothetical protein